MPLSTARGGGGGTAAAVLSARDLLIDHLRKDPEAVRLMRPGSSRDPAHKYSYIMGLALSARGAAGAGAGGRRLPQVVDVRA